MDKTAPVRTPIDYRDSTMTAASPIPVNIPSNTSLTSSIKSCLSGLLSYVFNRFLMHIPSCYARLLFFRLRVAKLGTDVGLLMGVELHKSRNVFIGDRVLINKRVSLDGRGGRLVIGHDQDIAQETNIWTWSATSTVILKPPKAVMSSSAITSGLLLERRFFRVCGSGMGLSSLQTG
jgi:hypothetical protein